MSDLEAAWSYAKENCDNEGCGAETFLAGCEKVRRELEENLAKVRKEMNKVYTSSSICAHRDFEPDTCMEYMRCEMCGMPAHLAALLSAADGHEKNRGE
jgi:hypothetical protein